MTIYVLRYNSLLKIGYSSDLAARVQHIIASIPGDVRFVGHMPGDRDVEAHLHAVFAPFRFSGEWFHDNQALAAFCAILLPDLPPTAKGRRVPRARTSAGDVRKARLTLRKYAADRWPNQSHKARTECLAEELGWPHSRVFSTYNGDERMALRAFEMEAIGALAGTRTPGADE